MRNKHRLADITVDLWVEERELFDEHFTFILGHLTNAQGYVILTGDRPIGFIDCERTPTGTRIGYVIDGDFEGLGIMGRHLRELIDHLPRPISARILHTNTRSIALVERLGFRQDELSLCNEHYHWLLE